MRQNFLLSLMYLLGLPGALLAAEGPSYSYFDAEYRTSDFSDYGDYGINDYGDGYALEGSMGFGPHFSGFIGYSRDEHEEFNLTIEYTEIGIGTNWSLSPRTDFVARAAYVAGQADFGIAGDPNSDGDGLRLDIGLRGKLTDRWEVDLGAMYRDVEGIWDGSALTLDTQFFFTNWLALQAGTEFGNDAVLYSAGLRISFGP